MVNTSRTHYVIQRNFKFTFVKNDKERVTAQCDSEGCQWHIHASKGR